MVIELIKEKDLAPTSGKVAHLHRRNRKTGEISLISLCGIQRLGTSFKVDYQSPVCKDCKWKQNHIRR